MEDRKTELHLEWKYRILVPLGDAPVMADQLEGAPGDVEVEVDGIQLEEEGGKPVEEVRHLVAVWLQVLRR